MYKFAITTDMAADMPEGFFAENGVDVVPMPFSVGSTDYYHRELPSYPEFYDMMRGGETATTSQTSSYDAIKVFEKYLEQGLDVLHVSFSSGMSGGFAALTASAAELERRFKGRKVLVLDSLSGCGGQGLIVRDALRMREEGKTVDEIFSALQDARMNYHHFFIVEDLNTLYRGGRLSRLEAAVGTLLGIKPLLELNHSGKIMPLLKVMGKKKAIAALAEQVGKYYRPADDDVILVEHGDDMKGAQTLAGKILEIFPEAKIEYAFVNYLVGAHAGPGALAVFFKGVERPRFINLPFTKEN